MTKGLRVFCPSMVFSKACTFLNVYILSHLFSFYNNFPPPPQVPLFFSFIQFTTPHFLALISVTLDHNIPQNLHFFIFNNFWGIFMPFFTSFQVAFTTQFQMNYSCNIIVPSVVLLLCQLFTLAHNMRYCFIFLVTHSTKW